MQTQDWCIPYGARQATCTILTKATACCTDKTHEADAMLDQAEKLKAGVRAKVEHPFRVLKRQFGHVKVRYRGLKKNTQQLMTLFALSNLWMVRSKLMGVGA